MYRYNITDTDDNERNEREYFDRRSYYSNTIANALNQNHVFRARIDFKPNAYHELRIRPMVLYQGNRSNRNGYEIYYPVPPATSPVDSLGNSSGSDGAGLRTGLNANYRVRLGKPGRTLSMFFMGSYNLNDMTAESKYDRLVTGTPVTPRPKDGERSVTDNWGYDAMSGVSYTEPVSKNSLISFDYSARYSFSDQDRRASLYDNATADYAANPNDNYSGVYTSGYLTHRVGPGYRLQSDKTAFSVGVYYEHATLSSDRVLPNPSNLKRGFDAATYSLMVNSKFGQGASLRLFLFSHTENPQIADLQDVFDMSQSQNIRRGNVSLKPAYNNRMFMRFIVPTVEKGRTFSIGMHAGYTLNAITRRTISESAGYVVPGLGGRGHGN